jgi:hypothetical protein
MISALTIIAERHISEAINAGTLRIDGWKNRPLPMEDDSFIPDDLKMAYKILKNSGHLPPEVETRKEINNLEDLIKRTDDEHLRLKQMKKLNVLIMKLDAQRSRPSPMGHDDEYYAKIVNRVSSSAGKKPIE